MLELSKQLGKVVVVSMLIGTVWAGPNSHAKTKVMVFGGDEAEVIQVDQLEIGESREFVTDSGRNVIVVRDESGLVVDVDGELIDISGAGTAFDLESLGAGEGRVVIVEDVDETLEDGRHIVIKHRRVIADGDRVDIDQLMSDLDLEDQPDSDREIVVIKKRLEISDEEI